LLQLKVAVTLRVTKCDSFSIQLFTQLNRDQF